MIDIMVTMGQLGNRMLLFSNVLATGIEYNQDITHLYFEDINNYFDINKDKIPINVYYKSPTFSCWFKKNLRNISYRIYGKKDVLAIKEDIDNDIKKRKNTQVCIWQYRNHELLKKYQGDISEYFAPKKEHIDFAKKILEPFRGKERILGVHIRKGDYKIWQNGRYYFDDEKYSNWIHDLYNECGSKCVFVLFSNEDLDISKFNNGLQVYKSNGNTMEDLVTMSMCDYIMGPLSTYSWWAAFWGRKKYLRLEPEYDNISFKMFSDYADNRVTIKQI